MRPSWTRPNPADAANQSGGDVAPAVPRGAINTAGTGEYYPPAAGGVIDPRAGTFYQDVGGEFVVDVLSRRACLPESRYTFFLNYMDAGGDKRRCKADNS